MTTPPIQTLQIVTFGGEDYEGIRVGIRSFPLHELHLICFESDRNKADEFSKVFRNTLGIAITINVVTKENVILDTIQKITEILGIHRKHFRQVLINVSCGEELLNCAALCAAFVNGVMAIGTDRTSQRPLVLPVLRLSYTKVLSEAKIKILKAIKGVTDDRRTIESLEQLSKISGHSEAALSYHIRGEEGLANLGLIDVQKGKRGKVSVELSVLGKLLLIGVALRKILVSFFKSNVYVK